MLTFVVSEVRQLGADLQSNKGIFTADACPWPLAHIRREPVQWLDENYLCQRIDHRPNDLQLMVLRHAGKIRWLWGNFKKKVP
jgi:hypothetical protein